MSNALIAGGAGFLGINLAKAIRRQGHQVTILDNFVTGSKAEAENLIANDKGVTLVRHDVTMPIPTDQFLDISFIYNFACPASPPQYQKFPLRTLKTSILGSINLLDLADNLKIPYLFASTSEIYGDPLVSPQHENYWGNVNPIGIRACYDEGKRVGEALVMDYGRERNLNGKICRIFNTFGPGMDLNDGRVMSNYIRNALQGSPLEVNGDGSQTRSFCYVDDLTEGVMSLASSECTGPINLGNTAPISMLDLAKEVILKTQSNSQIIFKDLPGDDPKLREPDISLAKELLSWEPRTPYANGIEKMIEDFRLRMAD
jgi:UDP-glucuronate decarboxylase